MTVEQLVVLIVEPSSTQWKIINHALHDLGILTTLGADTGASALKVIEQEEPDLVISAMYLEDMTGSDLVHQIRELPENSDTAFMLISSETRFRYLDPIRQAGAVGLLPKPFSKQDLSIALNATLDLVDPDAAMDHLDAESLHVLVVDDSNLARKHIARVLNSMGIQEITHACDGVDALEKLRDHYFDFVVTDYNMPNMDGKELVDNIRGNSSQSSIPILMVTSEDNDKRLAAVQQSGISAICDKPFEPSNVRQLIGQLFS